MSRGVLIFAHDGGFEYTKLAEIAAKRVKQYLKLPITLITDKNYKDKHKIFDNVIRQDITYNQSRVLKDGKSGFEKIQWLNFTRSLCYDLSPYDETIVIDADYIVNSKHLLSCFELNSDFLIYKDSFHLLHDSYSKMFESINCYTVPFFWATVFYFKKTEQNRLLFKLVDFIKNNWEYYRLIYQISDIKYRNDYSFSIAINLLLSNATVNEFSYIPGKLYYTTDEDDVFNNDTEIIFDCINSDRALFTVKNLDVHIMNKHALLRISQ